LCGFCCFLFNFPCSILSHGKWGTFVFSASIGLADTVSSSRWCARTAGLLRRVNF
jgi:hypothetical protein